MNNLRGSEKMAQSVYVAGVGMTKFNKLGNHDPYPVFGAAAVRDALADAGATMMRSSRLVRDMFTATAPVAARS